MEIRGDFFFFFLLNIKQEIQLYNHFSRSNTIRMNVLGWNNRKGGGGRGEALRIKPLLNKNVVF